MSILDKPQLAAIAAARGARKVKRLFNNTSTSLTGLSSLIPTRIIKAPTELKTADIQLAKEYYEGRFVFSGKLVEGQGNDPFKIQSRGDAWECELNGFEWLRHLSANKENQYSQYACTLIESWIEKYINTDSSAAWNLKVTSIRLISWLSNSILIVSNSEHEFHERFMRIIGNHIRFLKREVSNTAETMTRIYALAALSYASVCQENQSKALNTMLDKLAYEVNEQVLIDGSHKTRNPATIIDLLVLLLPLQKVCEATETEFPQLLSNAIERLLIGLRNYKLTDGSLAHFNGSGHVERELLATLLRYDDFNLPSSEDPISGYERIKTENSTLIMDVGQTPKGELSLEAHAGCLSFEFSHENDVIITNCGVPRFMENNVSQEWRATKSHSTAVINNTSSCKFENTSSTGIALGGLIYASNLKPEIERSIQDETTIINAAHHGYVRDYNIRHQRTISLNKNGTEINGNDRFSAPDKSDLRNAEKDKVSIHFHLAPAVKASVIDNKRSCLIETRSGTQWVFTSQDIDIELVESTFFAGIAGPLFIWQIVIHAGVAKTPEIKWALQKLKAD